MFYTSFWKLGASVYSLPFLSNYFCNTRTFVTLNSFSEKVLNWLDLKTSPFSLWFVLEKIAFKGFDGKKRGLRGKKGALIFLCFILGHERRGLDGVEKFTKYTTIISIFSSYKIKRDLEHEQIYVSNRTKKPFCLISCTMNDIVL